MTTDDNDAKKALEKARKEMKKKAKLTVPTDFLDNAKSYDDKLALVKILSEKEKQRVVLMFKKMIDAGIKEEAKKKGLK